MAQFKEKLIAKESLEGRLLFAVPKSESTPSAVSLCADNAIRRGPPQLGHPGPA